MRVLITAGGTEEPIDGVRFIGNLSSGATGLEIARRLKEHGCEVCLLHAWRVNPANPNFETQSFRTFDELASALRACLEARHFDAVVHLAAVSDYRVAAIEVDGQRLAAGAGGKIDSGRELVLHMKPNPKLLDSLKRWSANASIRVVAFKLTNGADPASQRQAVTDLLGRGVADLVVHNDLSQIGPDRHHATLYAADGGMLVAHTKAELSGCLLDVLGLEERP